MPGAMSLLALFALVSTKVLALVALGSMASRALRRSSAACRHALWAAVIGSALLMAVTAPFSPFWSVPVGESFATMDFTVRREKPVAPVPGDPAAHGAADPRLASALRSRVGPALALIWMAGVALFFLRIAAGRVALRRIAASASAIGTGPALEWLATLAGSSRVRLLETDALLVPVTWGTFRPVVALPMAARAWPATRLEWALRHEMAHVRRRDAFMQTAAEVCRGLLWFHPAVWYAARRMRQEAEYACDDAVLASGSPGIAYAEWLLDLARNVPRGGAGTVTDSIALAEARGFERRLRSILDPATRRASSRALMASAPAGVLVATVAIAGLGLAGASAPSPDEVTFGERAPMDPERERWALQRVFQPRDASEATAFERLREGARHEKQHDFDLIRERSLWALSIAKDDEVVAPLVNALESADWRVRAYAAWSLGVADAGGARAELTSALRDPVWRVRANAASALAALGDPASTPDMLLLLVDPAWQVRLPAAEFLTRAGTAEALTALRTLRNDPNIGVRSVARSSSGEPGT